MRLDQLLDAGFDAAEARDFIGAIENFMEARDLSAAAGDQLSAAFRGVDIARAALSMGWFDTSVEMFAKAKTTIDECGTSEDRAGFALNYGTLLHNLSHNGGQEELHQQALRQYSIAKQAPLRNPEGFLLRAHATFNAANIRLCLGQWKAAVRDWESASRSYLMIGAEEYVPDVQRAKGDGLISRGMYREAIELLPHAKSGYSAQGRPFEAARVLRLEGHARFHLGEFEAAETLFKQSVEFFSDTSDGYTCLMSMVDWATTLEAQGKPGVSEMRQCALNKLLDGRPVDGSTIDPSFLADLEDSMADHVHPPARAGS
jgi:tetratricopeptide (TPR) repeat protein